MVLAAGAPGRGGVPSVTLPLLPPPAQAAALKATAKQPGIGPGPYWPQLPSHGNSPQPADTSSVALCAIQGTTGGTGLQSSCLVGRPSTKQVIAVSSDRCMERRGRGCRDAEEGGTEPAALGAGSC